MNDQEWARATTPQKLDWMRDQLSELLSYLNGVSMRTQSFEKRATAQALQAHDQIGDLTARVAALEAEAAQRSAE